MNGLKNARNRRDDALTRVAWDRLEALLADYYRGQGWAVEHVGTGAGRTRFDGGIDLKLRRHDRYVVVQCKHWSAKQVTHNAVHELLGIKVNENATGAIVVTSGEFTQAARHAATRQDQVQLIDGDALRAMLGPQLDALAAAEPPPLPMAPFHHRKQKQLPAGGRALLLSGTLMFAGLVCYGLYRLATWPLNHTIKIELPQRPGARPQESPSQQAYPPVVRVGAPRRSAATHRAGHDRRRTRGVETAECRIHACTGRTRSGAISSTGSTRMTAEDRGRLLQRPAGGD